jgi:hypothetical protein
MDAPIFETSMVSGEKYYYLDVHYSASSHRVTLILESLTGNADLYVNPAESGYYGREGVSTADWTSSSYNYLDEVNVLTEPSQPAGTDSYRLLISVNCLGECRYQLRAFEELTPSVLLEGVPLSLDVMHGAYRCCS